MVDNTTRAIEGIMAEPELSLNTRTNVANIAKQIYLGDTLSQFIWGAESNPKDSIDALIESEKARLRVHPKSNDPQEVSNALFDHNGIGQILASDILQQTDTNGHLSPDVMKYVVAQVKGQGKTERDVQNVLNTIAQAGAAQSALGAQREALDDAHKDAVDNDPLRTGLIHTLGGKTDEDIQYQAQTQRIDVDNNKAQAAIDDATKKLGDWIQNSVVHDVDCHLVPCQTLSRTAIQGATTTPKR